MIFNLTMRYIYIFIWKINAILSSATTPFLSTQAFAMIAVNNEDCILQLGTRKICTVPIPRHWFWLGNIRQRATFSSQFASEYTKSPQQNNFGIVYLYLRIQYYGRNEADDRDRHGQSILTARSIKVVKHDLIGHWGDITCDCSGDGYFDSIYIPVNWYVRWIINYPDRRIDRRGINLPWILKYVSQHVRIPWCKPL